MGISDSALQGSGDGEGIVFLLGFQQVFCIALLVSVLGIAGPPLPVTSGTREESESILKIGYLRVPQLALAIVIIGLQSCPSPWISNMVYLQRGCVP